MKRAKYRGDVTDQFRVGQIIGQLDSGAYIRCTAVEYDENTDRTYVDGEHTTPTAPEGMRMRYHGAADPNDQSRPDNHPPLLDPIEAK